MPQEARCHKFVSYLNCHDNKSPFLFCTGIDFFICISYKICRAHRVKNGKLYYKWKKDVFSTLQTYQHVITNLSTSLYPCIVLCVPKKAVLNVGSFDDISFVVMTSNILWRETNLTTFCYCIVCSQSATRQKNYKNDPASRFVFWLFHKNHSCLLVMIGKTCGNYTYINEETLFAIYFLFSTFFWGA